MENTILHMALQWGLARLAERNTWVTWLSLIGVKFGITFAPQFDTLVVNAALGVVAVIGYAVQGTPIFTKKGK